MIDAKEFLRTVKSLTGIQATPNVFKDATLTDDERMLVFWAASGR
jgi:hypothetical protein